MNAPMGDIPLFSALVQAAPLLAALAFIAVLVLIIRYSGRNLPVVAMFLCFAAMLSAEPVTAPILPEVPVPDNAPGVGAYIIPGFASAYSTCGEDSAESRWPGYPKEFNDGCAYIWFTSVGGVTTGHAQMTSSFSADPDYFLFEGGVELWWDNPNPVTFAVPDPAAPISLSFVDARWGWVWPAGPDSNGDKAHIWAVPVNPPVTPPLTANAPEPGTIMLFGSGLALLLFGRQARKAIVPAVFAAIMVAGSARAAEIGREWTTEYGTQVREVRSLDGEDIYLQRSNTNAAAVMVTVVSYATPGQPQLQLYKVGRYVGELITKLTFDVGDRVVNEVRVQEFTGLNASTTVLAK